MASFSVPETFVWERLKILSNFNSTLGLKYFIMWNDSDQSSLCVHEGPQQLWTYSSRKRVRLVYGTIRNSTDQWNSHYYVLKNVWHTHWSIYCCAFCWTTQTWENMSSAPAPEAAAHVLKESQWELLKYSLYHPHCVFTHTLHTILTPTLPFVDFK